MDVESREELGTSKVKHLRDEGLIPGVIYGQGNESKAVKVSHREFIILIHQHRLENMVIDIKIKGDKGKSYPCLVKEIQYDPVKDNIMHVDFNEVSLTEMIKVNVPVSAFGEPVGVKQEGGSLEHILWEIEVECLPADIPEKIEFDVANLKMKESVHVKDIKFPANVKVLTDPEAIVLSVSEPMKEEVPVEAVEGAESQEPEVIKEKKEAAEEGAEQEEEEKEKPQKEKPQEKEQ